MRARLSLVIAASLGLAACQGDENLTPSSSAPSLASAEAQENLLTLANETALNATQRGQLAAIKGRPGTADVHVARLASAPGQLLRGNAALRLAVAPGVQVVAGKQNFKERSTEDVSWSGPLRGQFGWVQAVYADGGLTATVTIGEDAYRIEPLGDGLHAVSKLDQSTMPPEHSDAVPAGALTLPIEDLLPGVRAARAGSGDVSLAAVSTINVLVVYTASAASAAGNISSKIQLAVDETNQSYANSGISINMVKVATSQVTYSESGRSFSQHVNALVSSTDGIMDNVHTLRNTYGADMVMLVVNDTEACGQAAAIKAVATNAFAVADQSCITGYYSFGHELGHLQGARHDRFVDSSTSPYSYGHGYIPSTKNWRTVMAYGNNCSNCKRIQYWSNPLKTYPSTGQVMGTATYEDNARVLNLTAPTVALFR